LLDAPVGVKRVLGRLRRPSNAAPVGSESDLVSERRGDPALSGLRRLAAAARFLPQPARRSPVAAPSHAPVATVAVRTIGPERIVAVSIVAIVLVASALSLTPTGSRGAAPPLVLSGAVAGAIGEPDLDELPISPVQRRDVALGGPIGGPEADGPGARISIGGVDSSSMSDVVYGAPVSSGIVNKLARLRPVDLPDDVAVPAGDVEAEVRGPFLDDGTLVKPVAVNTTVVDGSGLLRTYKIRADDTVAEIAKRHGVSTRTVWWANDLKSLTKLPTGTILTIPPVSGLVVVIGSTDTLATLAQTHRIESDAILVANHLEDPNLVVGQILVLPGAVGTKPLPKPKAVARAAPSRSGGRSIAPPARYNGGTFAWPVAGGYLSQGYRSGHYGIDIAADSGTRVKAAAGGKVIFAGWKSNGGGYQVWIAHGSSLYTTYNHMSGVSVGRGQSVDRGQQVGRVGSTGFASGSHLHFEVWRGMIWREGRRVNPSGYL